MNPASIELLGSKNMMRQSVGKAASGRAVRERVAVLCDGRVDSLVVPQVPAKLPGQSANQRKVQ